MYSDDPLRDFERYEAEQYERLQELPLCAHCGEHIQEEYGFYINDEWYHEDCFKSEYFRTID